MAERPHVPVSRRERPAKPPLARGAIVDAALRVMRSEGLERATMRRVAQELDTGAASLYVYVQSTADLHAWVLDEMLASVDLSPVDAPGEWCERLVRVLMSYAEVLFEYPTLARSAMVMRPSGPRCLALVEVLLGLLAEGGVPGGRAAWGVDLLLQFATATAAEQGTRDQASGAQAEQDALTEALRTVDPQVHPHIAGLADELVSGPELDRLAWGFDVLINGIRRTPRPRRPRLTGPARDAAEGPL